MRIISLSGKNLASLEEEFHINFEEEPLKSAGIFAITGPTGGGKSTLLDALCLALYAKTPRQSAAVEKGVEISDGMSKISQNDPRSILRKSAAECYAAAVFVGLDGRKYRSEWSVRRARNKVTGSLQDYNIELWNISDNLLFPEKKTGTLNEIVRLVGLTFEQFTRSVLLAQGDFTAFLKAGKDDKAALLEKLTGSEIYSKISRTIFGKTKEAEQIYKSTKNQIDDIEILEDEKIAELLNEKKTVEAEIAAQKEQEKNCRKNLQWFEELEKLTEEVNAAFRTKNEIIAQKENAGLRIAKFRLVESVQPARELVQMRDRATLQKKEFADRIVQERHNLEEMEEKLASLAAQKQSMDIKRKLFEEEYNAAKPLLEEAKKLDTQLTFQQKQTDEAKQQADLESNSKSQQEQLLKIKEENFQKLSRQTDEVENWISQNSNRKAIAENQFLIVSRLEDADKLIAKKAEIAAKIESKNQEIKKIVVAVGETEQKRLKNEQQSAELKTGLVLKKKVLDSIPYNQIVIEEKQQNQSMNSLIQLRLSWEKLYAAQKNKSLVLNKLEHNECEIKSISEAFIDCSQKLAEAKARKEQSQIALDKARLITADNVEMLRENLIENEPCPVCGSAHHPFADAGKRFHAVLEELLHQDKECAAVYDSLLKNFSKLEQKKELLMSESAQFSEQLAEIEKLLSELTEVWNRACPESEILQTSENERTELIDVKIEKLRNSSELLQKQMEQYREMQILYESEREKFEKVAEESNVISKEIVRQAGDKHLLEQGMQHLSSEMQSAESEFEKIMQEIGKYFVQPDWQKKWLLNGADFCAKLKEFSSKWTNQNELLNKYSQEKKLLDAEIIRIKQRFGECSQIYEKAFSRFMSVSEELEKLRKNRQAIFKGQPVDMVEKRFTNALTKLNEELESINNQILEQQSALSAKKGAVLQLEKQLEEISADLLDKSRAVNNWIEDFNEQTDNILDNRELETLLQFSPAWMGEERKALQDLENAVLQAQTAVEERVNRLENHKKQAPEMLEKEELLQQLTAINQQIDEKSEQKNNIDFRLRQNAENLQKVGSLYEIVKSLGENMGKWQKLNDLIGSADGKKFRQIAQEYTLEFLLNFANAHLETLSNRYALQLVPDSLALQVIDHDMGDEVRTVHSLSGGESFLVSLSLALGLASLSSNRMKIESLFIDEGFGSLDPQTLQMVIDALERLQNQGRKVGVISHVQELTERIPAQIRVIRQSKGKSRVEVGGF